MRRGDRRVDLSLPASRDALDRPPAGSAPHGAAKPSGKVRPDGTVDVGGPADVDIRWAAPTPKIIGIGFAEWYESDKGPDAKRGKQTLAPYFGGSIDSGDGGLDKGDRSRTTVVTLFRGGANVTEWLMRRTGAGDPWEARKRAQLDATRAERAEIIERRRAELLKQTAQIVRANLERAWAANTDPAARKAALFELWDEIAEPEELGGDDVLAAASRAARAQVIGFIRARLPRRGEGAYSEAEIVRLNTRRRSRARFSPYE